MANFDATKVIVFIKDHFPKYNSSFHIVFSSKNVRFEPLHKFIKNRYGKKTSEITQNTQELRGLIIEIENKLDFRPKKYTDYEKLKELIEAQIKPGILPESTLKRLWGYEKYVSTFNYFTLDSLSKVAGYRDWEHYIKTISDKNDLIPIFDDRKIQDAEEDLNIGDTIILGWYPERYAEVEYMGYCEFKVLKYKGRGKDLTNKIITARWFEVVPEWINNKNGHGYSMYCDIAGVLGNEIYERLYL